MVLRLLWSMVGIACGRSFWFALPLLGFFFGVLKELPFFDFDFLGSVYS